MTLFVQELDRRKCKGIGGIHWDEMLIRRGVTVCRRTNELVGFEDLDINNEYIDTDMLSDQHNNTTEDDEDDEILSTASVDSDYEEKDDCNNKQPIARMILQYFWTSVEGDFSWPVASFPLDTINWTKLTKCTDSVLKAIGSLKYNDNNKVQVVYGVCDGATHSAAFFERAGKIDWQSTNKYNDDKPIFWLCDPPHVMKRLRNFVLSANRDLQLHSFHIKPEHFFDVVMNKRTKLSSKHVNLDKCTKMNVKRAVETLSEHVAEDMKYGSYEKPDTWLTRQYINKCAMYFSVMNNVKDDHSSMRKLMSVLLFFKHWYEVLKSSENKRDAKTKLTDYWKQFISHQSYRDILRSIRGFLALQGYLHLNHPSVQFIPRTTNQDDVENYFSLQRARISGGEPTVEQYMDGNSTLSTSFLLKAEESDLGEQFGCYNKAALPNFVSVPLQRKTKSIGSDHTTSHSKLWSTADELQYIYPTPSSKSVHLFHSNAQQLQLLRQARLIIKIILLRLPKVHIQFYHHILSAINLSTNRNSLLEFLTHLDYKLRTHYYNDPSWRNSTYKESMELMKKDRDIRHWWEKLLNSANVTTSSKDHCESSVLLLGRFVNKFAQRRCVTYLANDGMNPTLKSTAIRKHLKETSMAVGEIPSADDLCFNCGVKGHWAKQCKEKKKHESEWVKLQRCYLCGELGHLRKMCPKMHNISDKNHRTQVAQILQLPSLKAEEFIGANDDGEPDMARKDSRYFKQCSPEWFEARRGRVTGSTAATALGWRGKKLMNEMYDSLRKNKDTHITPNAAMKWGTMCEESGAVTYIHYMNVLKFVQTGFWVNDSNDWLGASPDGIANDEVVIEIKCPYTNGKLFPYKNIPVHYIPQVQLEMYVTNTDVCHFVCWSPKKCNIYKVKRNENIIQLLLQTLKHFRDSAKSGEPVNLTKQSALLKLQAKQIVKESELIRSGPSFRTADIANHKYFNDFCNSDVHMRQAENSNIVKLDVAPGLQSYSYNSGGIGNSCFIDTFLESMYNVICRQSEKFQTTSNQSEVMSTFMKSLILRLERKYHDSKMLLWHYLQNHTKDGKAVFQIGNMAAIANIFDKFYENMSDNERHMFFLKTSLYNQCPVTQSHSKQQIAWYQTLPLLRKSITLQFISNQGKGYNVIELIEFILTQERNQSIYKCHKRTGDKPCNSTLITTSSVINEPCLFAVELEKDEQNYLQPFILENNMDICIGQGAHYDLAAIIYHHNNHFWSEIFCANDKPGWYLYNDIVDGGKTKYVGRKPLTSNLGYMYLLLFEKQSPKSSSSMYVNRIIKDVLSMFCTINTIPHDRQNKFNLLHVLQKCKIEASGKDSMSTLREKILTNKKQVKCEWINLSKGCDLPIVNRTQFQSNNTTSVGKITYVKTDSVKSQTVNNPFMDHNYGVKVRLKRAYSQNETNRKEMCKRKCKKSCLYPEDEWVK